MSNLYILFEHASGYGLFSVREFEDIAMFNKQVEESVTDVSRFQALVNLVAFFPFPSAGSALDNLNNVTEGVVHEDLRLFLETNLPKSSKKRKITLGVSDSKLAAAIQESLSATCQHVGTVPEILRGIRVHFAKLMRGLTDVAASKAQLGLGHSYSRSKVKFNVNRVDNMIIQAISLLDQLDKDINTFTMRIREWYSYHFPELVRLVTDSSMYTRCANFVGDRKTFTDDKLNDLAELTGDQTLAEKILAASKISMGMDISMVDLINIRHFAGRVIALADYRKELHTYLVDKMSVVAPNLSCLIGEQVGARLISHAGSLTSLAKYPASTVQILGAEKALFRALKTRGNTPKYGLIFHSTFIGKAGAKNKGRISRYLANKCSIASRIDCFSDIPTKVFGEHLRQQVEDRLAFYENGTIPKKNLDVMREAIAKAEESREDDLRRLRKQQKREKKKLKRQRAEQEETEAEIAKSAGSGDVEEKPAKKKKRKQQEDEEKMAAPVVVQSEDQELGESDKMEKKKKKKKRKAETVSEALEVVAPMEGETVPEEIVKKNKKKKDKMAAETAQADEPERNVLEESGAKKSKKEKKKRLEEQTVATEDGAETKKAKKKAKKEKIAS